MATQYLNIKHYGITETIDHINSSDFKTYSEFRKEKQRLLAEYAMCGQSGAYWSRRSTNYYRSC